MPAVTLLIAVLLQAAPPPAPRRAAPGDGGALSAAAQASMRPPECVPRTDAAGLRANVWEAAKQPKLAPYCDRIAKGYGLLATAPARAHAIASEADELMPGHAAPWVLRGRASVALAAFERAESELERALMLSPRALEDPPSLRAFARALGRSGKRDRALAAYRLLCPRLSLAFAAEERGAILIEAAEVALGLGPAALDDAIAFLEEARSLSVRDLRPVVLAELVLAFERRSLPREAESARAAFMETAFDPRALESRGEVDAAAASVLASTDVHEARERWEHYLAGEGGSGPWAAHARRQRDVLAGKDRGRAGR
jgi:tetratricopeptide (TPR) repeat protein